MLDGVDLRDVRRELELVRRIYVAVRDRNWNTIPGEATRRCTTGTDSAASAPGHLGKLHLGS